MKEKIRLWLCENLIRAVLWLTNGVQVEIKDDARVIVSCRHFRTKALVSPPQYMDFSRGHSLLYFGDWK